MFEDPDTFKPERSDKSDDIATKDLYQFLPFLIDLCMCLGYKLTWQNSVSLDIDYNWTHV